jgi:hypothetical protein
VNTDISWIADRGPTRRVAAQARAHVIELHARLLARALRSVGQSVATAHRLRERRRRRTRRRPHGAGAGSGVAAQARELAEEPRRAR